MRSNLSIPNVIILSLWVVILAQGTAGASEFSFSSETILRVFEREDPAGEKASVIPVYEYISVGYGDPEYGGFSLHANGWGRFDFADKDYYQNNPEGYLFDGYVQYADPDHGLDAKLGRQHIFAGIVNESVDGLGFKTRAGAYASVLAYGGYPVGYEDQNGRKGDSIFGGRLAFGRFFPGEAGVSYKSLRDDNMVIDHAVGADFSLFLSDRVAFTGLSSWNLETEAWGEHSYTAELFFSQVSLKARYQRFRFEDYFYGASHSQAFDFLQDTDENLTIVGGDAVWQQFHGFDAGLKLNHYTYDVRQETSRYAGLVFNRYGQGSTSVGGEVGMMDGEAPENNYYLGRVYFYWDAPVQGMEAWFVDGEFMYVGYEEEIYGKDSSLFSSVGCGRTIMGDALKIKISGDYSSDPYHDADIRFMSVLQYDY